MSGRSITTNFFKSKLSISVHSGSICMSICIKRGKKSLLFFSPKGVEGEHRGHVSYKVNFFYAFPNNCSLIIFNQQWGQTKHKKTIALSWCGCNYQNCGLMKISLNFSIIFNSKKKKKYIYLTPCYWEECCQNVDDCLCYKDIDGNFLNIHIYNLIFKIISWGKKKSMIYYK